MASSIDPDQTASRSSLIWAFTVCSDLPYLFSHKIGFALSRMYSEQSLFIMTFRHKAFINIMKFVRDYIFECFYYSQDSYNPESSVNTQIYFIMLMKALCRNVIKSDSSE